MELDSTSKGRFANLSRSEDKRECHNTNNENKTLYDNAMRRSSFQVERTKSRNGYEREKNNEICHPQHNLCLNDLDVETNKVVVESWPSGINKSGKMCNDSFNCSLQSPKSGEMIHHKTSNKKQRQNDSCCNISSFVICDIKQQLTTLAFILCFSCQREINKAVDFYCVMSLKELLNHL